MSQSHEKVPSHDPVKQEGSPYVFKFRYMPILFLVSAVCGYVFSFGGPFPIALACGLVIIFSFVSSISNFVSSLRRNQASKCVRPGLEIGFYILVLGILIPAALGHVKAVRDHYRKTHPGEVMPWEKQDR